MYNFFVFPSTKRESNQDNMETIRKLVSKRKTMIDSYNKYLETIESLKKIEHMYEEQTNVLQAELSIKLHHVQELMRNKLKQAAKLEMVRYTHMKNRVKQMQTRSLTVFLLMSRMRDLYDSTPLYLAMNSVAETMKDALDDDLLKKMDDLISQTEAFNDTKQDIDASMEQLQKVLEENNGLLNDGNDMEDIERELAEIDHEIATNRVLTTLPQPSSVAPSMAVVESLTKPVTPTASVNNTIVDPTDVLVAELQ